MITLYRTYPDSEADRLEEAIKNLVLAYKTHELSQGKALRIRDGDRTLREQNEIDEWLIELTRELKWHRSLSGDGCYIDPETGETCSGYLFNGHDLIFCE